MSENVGGIIYTVDIETAALTKGADRINNALDVVGTGAAKVDKEAGKASAAVNATGSAMVKVASQAGDAGRAVNKFADSVAGVKAGSAKGVLETADSIKEASKASDDANDPLKKLAETMAEGTNNANSFTFSMSALAQAIAAVAFSGAVLGVAEMVQKYEEMADRIQLATNGMDEYRMVQQRLLNTANGTYRSLQEAQELYILTANSLRSLGYTTAQALDTTDSLSYAFVKNATTADKAKSAIDAFSGAVTTGKVEGDAWKSLISATPSLIEDIAKASGKTGTEIRKLGAEGKITATQLTEGLRKSLESNTKAAAAMSSNLTDASTRSKTAITALFVEVERQTGTLQSLTNGIILAADSLLKMSTDSDTVAGAITAVSSTAAVLAAIIVGHLGSAALGYVGTQGALLVATLRQITADQAAAAAAIAVARANEAAAATALALARANEAAAVGFAHHAQMALALANAEAAATAATANLNAALTAQAGLATRATLAMRGLQSVMAFLGGPTGVILIAAAALYYFSKAASDTKVDVDNLNKSLGTLTFNQLSKSANDVTDDIAKLEKQLASAKQEQASISKLSGGLFGLVKDETTEDFKKRQVAAAAAVDTVNQELKKRRDALVEIEKAQKKLKDTPTPTTTTADPKLQDDADAAKVIKDLKDQEELLKVIGEERAKLATIQKLGDNASPAQRKEAEALAASIFKLQEAEKAQKTSSKKLNSEAASEQKKNQKTIEDLENSLNQLKMSARDASINKAVESLGSLATPEQVARVKELAAAAFDAAQAKTAADQMAALGEQMNQTGLKARELAQRQAQLALGQYATPDQISKVREMSGALFDLQQRQELLTSLRSDVPLVGAGMDYSEDLARYTQYKEQELITDQTYQDLRMQRERAYEEQKRALQEETFRNAAVGNEILMASIDSLGQSGAQAISGLLSGTSTLKEAMGGIANTVLNAVIGSFVQMGVDWVKQQVIMAASAQATQATQVAGTAAVTAAQTTATGTIAATTTTAAATTGAAVAGSMAPAAGLASIASFGSAAVIGGAALLATMGLAAAFGGGRQYGGGVAGNKLYRVNEGGAPEIFNAAGGKQYMMPNTRGEVVNNKDASALPGGGGGYVPAVINISNFGKDNISASSSFDAASKREIIDIVVGDGYEGGRVGRMVNDVSGTRRAGT